MDKPKCRLCGERHYGLCEGIEPSRGDLRAEAHPVSYQPPSKPQRKSWVRSPAHSSSSQSSASQPASDSSPSPATSAASECPHCTILRHLNGELELRVVQLEKLLEKAEARARKTVTQVVTETIRDHVTKSPIDLIPVTPHVTKKRAVTKSPPGVTKKGRPKKEKTLSGAERVRAYRARKPKNPG